MEQHEHITLYLCSPDIPGKLCRVRSYQQQAPGQPNRARSGEPAREGRVNVRGNINGGARSLFIQSLYHQVLFLLLLAISENTLSVYNNGLSNQ